MNTDTKKKFQELAEKVADYAGDPINLVRYLVRLMRDDRVPRSAKLKLLGSGLYAWIDGDLISDNIDSVPGLGYVDDVILLAHGVKCLISETDAQVAAELWPGDEESFKRVMTAVKWADDRLFERIRGWVKAAWDKIAGKAKDIKA
jgi:uncharacterized membrane protein YkvA (DUF1232 family)